MIARTGITRLRVYCAASVVRPHWKDFTCDELRLPDDMIMLHVGPASAPRLLEVRDPEGDDPVELAERKPSVFVGRLPSRSHENTRTIGFRLDDCPMSRGRCAIFWAIATLVATIGTAASAQSYLQSEQHLLLKEISRPNPADPLKQKAFDLEQGKLNSCVNQTLRKLLVGGPTPHQIASPSLQVVRSGGAGRSYS
jgi:hypothetical protein